jgi:tetratricopeptide (TPR) repeat protein
VLENSKRVRAYLSDFMADEPKAQKNTLLKCLEYGFYAELKNAPTEDRIAVKNRLVQKLHNEEGLETTLCAETLDLLEAVIFGEAAPEVSTAGDEWITVAEQQTAGQVQTTTPLPGPVPPAQPSPMNVPSGNISPNNHTKRNVLIAAAVIAMVLVGIWFLSPPGRMMRAKPYFEEGVGLFDQENYDGAIRSFTEAIRIHPEYADAYAYRGRSYAGKEDYDLAIADCNEAIRIDPLFVLAYISRGNAYSHKGNYDRAIADYNEAIRIDPWFVLAYISRGNTYSDKGDYDQAIADFTEAIRINPHFTNAYYGSAYKNRGDAYYSKQDYDRAIADYTQAIRLDPQDARYYYNRGNAYSDKQNYDQAIADYTQAIGIDPNFTEARNNLEIARRRGR